MTDDDLVRIFLSGRPLTTQRKYREALRQLRAALPSLGGATLDQLQRWAASLAHLAPATQKRLIATASSFYAFHQKQGTLSGNPATALRAPKLRDTLAERILTREQVHALLGAAACHRDRAALTVLYYGGLRASELCGLRWRDVQPRGDLGAQLAILGKGGKPRTVLLPPVGADPLLALRGAAAKPGDLCLGIDARTLHRIVKRSAKRAGLPDAVSPHWLRHALASHALDAGAPVHVVQQTLGHASLTTTTRYVHARPDEGAGQYLAQNSSRAA
jgi:integrase/recombinase XerD